MKLSTRITRTFAISTIAVSGSIAVAPHLAGAAQGPGDITNPTHCTHGCDGGNGGGLQGPDDFTAPTPPPVVDPGPEAQDPTIVVAQPTFTG